MTDENEKRHTLPTDWGIHVYETESGLIAIKQQDGQFGEDDSIIAISPERIEVVISFLRAVRDEILADRKDSDS